MLVSFSVFHIVQAVSGCEWDDETGETVGFFQYGYSGEDFLSLDFKTLTWVAPKPQAVATKLLWDADKYTLDFRENFNIRMCPAWLQMYFNYGKDSLLRTGTVTHPDVV